MKGQYRRAVAGGSSIRHDRVWRDNDPLAIPRRRDTDLYLSGGTDLYFTKTDSLVRVVFQLLEGPGVRRRSLRD